MPTKLSPVGSHIKTTLTSSVHTPTAPAGDADVVLVYVETVAVRYTNDGSTDPTSTTGMVIAVGSTVLIPYTAGTLPRFLGDGATIQLQWYKSVRAM